jgi:hypothetical protein
VRFTASLRRLPNCASAGIAPAKRSTSPRPTQKEMGIGHETT